MLPIIILALVLYIIYNKCNKYSPKKEFQRIIDEDNRLTKEKERIEREEYEINYKLEPLGYMLLEYKGEYYLLESKGYNDREAPITDTIKMNNYFLFNGKLHLVLKESISKRVALGDLDYLLNK